MCYTRYKTQKQKVIVNILKNTVTRYEKIGVAKI